MHDCEFQSVLLCVNLESNNHSFYIHMPESYCVQSLYCKFVQVILLYTHKFYQHYHFARQSHRQTWKESLIHQIARWKKKWKCCKMSNFFSTSDLTVYSRLKTKFRLINSGLFYGRLTYFPNSWLFSQHIPWMSSKWWKIYMYTCFYHKIQAHSYEHRCFVEESKSLVLSGWCLSVINFHRESLII